MYQCKLSILFHLFLLITFSKQMLLTQSFSYFIISKIKEHFAHIKKILPPSPKLFLFLCISFFCL